jgi:hypothetical protein
MVMSLPGVKVSKVDLVEETITVNLFAGQMLGHVTATVNLRAMAQPVYEDALQRYMAVGYTGVFLNDFLRVAVERHVRDELNNKAYE